MSGVPTKLFTRENAREMSAKGNYARWHKPAPEPTPEPLPAIPVMLPSATRDVEIREDLMRVKRKLDKLDELMDNAKSPQEWDQLSRAYDRMFKAWMVLSATPGPGNRKPTSRPDRKPQSYSDPTPAKSSDATPQKPSNPGQ